MVQRNMRFVLEEDNALVLRGKDGIEIRRESNIIPEGHSLVLASEDLSYITHGRNGFSYKRYNPENLAVEEEYGIEIVGYQSEYDKKFPLAAYCPRTKKAFFITICKTTREIKVYEKDNSESKTVDEDLPKMGGINFKKEVSFHSSYLGESKKISTVFLYGEDHTGYWQFAIDIPKYNKAPSLLTLRETSDNVTTKIWRRSPTRHSYSFGEGINPSSISRGRGGIVHFSTPAEDDDTDLKSDSFLPYKLKYQLTAAIVLFSSPFIFVFLMANLLFSILPQLWIDKYVNFVNDWNTYDCGSCALFTHQDIIQLTTIILGVILIFVVAALPKRMHQSIDLFLGNGIAGNSNRASKKYDSKLRKFSELLDCYQTSPTTIALLQKNKIQFYDFRTHQILEEMNVQGDFDKFLFLKKRASVQTYRQGEREIEKCESLILYKINNGSIQFKICNLDHEPPKVGPTNQYSITPKSDVSLKTVLIEGKYQHDAHLPFVLNTRVKIDHTKNPMRLTITHKGPDSGVVEFYNSLHNSPQVWSSIQQISNLAELLDHTAKDSEITFTLDDERTKVVDKVGFDVFSQTYDWESKSETNHKLRSIKGNTEIAPNLETAIFLHGEINSPVTTFIDTFSKSFPGLLRDVWTCRMGSKIHETRQEFGLEDDLPALAYMVGELDKFEDCNPKQKTKLWKNWNKSFQPEQINRVAQEIKKKINWPRQGYAHQLMHGDLTPANVIVNTGEIAPEIIEDADGELLDYSYPKEFYKLRLCDFHDLVVLDESGTPIYRRETVEDSEQMRTRTSSQFFDTIRIPKINPMLDLAKFLAHLLLKIPFEPSKRDRLNEVKYLLRTQARDSRGSKNETQFHEHWTRELEKALNWADSKLRASCALKEEGVSPNSWRELLKAMIFDQCLQIMMFWKGYRSEEACDLKASDLCWIFYRIGDDPQIYSPTIRDQFRNLTLSTANVEILDDGNPPEDRIHHQSGSFYDWAKNLLDVYNEQHCLEHDVVETTDDENQLDGPLYRLVFTQTAKDSLDNYTEKIYDPLKKWVSNLDLIGQSSKLDFEVWGQIQLYKSKLGQSSRVFFAIYDYGDDVILHVIGFYIDDD